MEVMKEIRYMYKWIQENEPLPNEPWMSMEECIFLTKKQ